MKSRVTTYILILAVVAVWGFIAWKILFPRPDLPVISNPPSIHHEMETPSEEHLLLNYKDPFLKDITNALSFEPAAATSPVSSLESPPFKYSGTISTGGRIYYIFECKGLLHSLTIGEIIEDYTFIRAFPDSVKLTMNGEVFTIPIER